MVPTLTLLVPLALSGSGSGACTTAADCALNGVCHAGRCRCEPHAAPGSVSPSGPRSATWRPAEELARHSCACCECGYRFGMSRRSPVRSVGVHNLHRMSALDDPPRGS